MTKTKSRNNAAIWDIKTLIQAGIDPKTGLPLKVTGGGVSHPLPSNILLNLSLLDEQNAVNRYQWYNLPEGLDSQLIERILYFKGQGAFFMLNGQFYFLPYALDGTIDVYGRYTHITPLPFGGTASEEKDGKQKAWITGLRFKVIKTLKLEYTEEELTSGCVLLHDYVKGLAETITPRSALDRPILNMMSEALPMARTSLIANCGVRTWRVNDENQQQNVEESSRRMLTNALTGEPFMPVVANLDLQDLSNGSALKSEEYLIYMQALDNLRLSMLGIDNGGLFQKKAYVDIAQQGVMGGPTQEILQDGLTIRQNVCDIINSIWDLGVWCDVSDAVMMADRDFDGVPLDQQDQSGAAVGQQPALGGAMNVLE